MIWAKPEVSSRWRASGLLVGVAVAVLSLATPALAAWTTSADRLGDRAVHIDRAADRALGELRTG